MKKLICLAGLAGAMAASRVYAGFDGTIDLDGGGGALQFGNGGEFNATTTPIGSSPNLGSFLTFCVELQEDINLSGGQNYNYQINTGAVADTGDSSGYGHIDATDPLAGPGFGKNMDNVSIGTAYLYSQFRAGNLNITSTQLAGNLQNAIWYLEGELTYAQMQTYNTANGLAFFNDAVTGTGTTGTDGTGTVFADSGGADGVVVLNLYNQDGSLAQDQLAIVPTKPLTGVSPACCCCCRLVRSYHCGFCARTTWPDFSLIIMNKQSNLWLKPSQRILTLLRAVKSEANTYK